MSFPLNQIATVWRAGAKDEGGDSTYVTPPQEVAVRWEDKVSKYMHQDGTEHVGNCVIYLGENLIRLDDKVFNGSRNAFLDASLSEAGKDALAVELGITREALNALLAQNNPIPALDYPAKMDPFAAPLVRTVGSAGNSPSLGGGRKLYKIIGE